MNNEFAIINNDKYGAPELKKVYQAYTFKGLIIAVTLHFAMLAAYMLFAYINESKAKDIPVNPKGPINFVEINTPPSVEDEDIPQITKEDIIQPIKDLAALEPLPVRKQDADDIILKTQDELNNIVTGVSREGDSLVASLNNNNIKVDDIKIDDRLNTEIKDPVKDIYNSFEVEVAPECTNLQQVKGSMTYPESAVQIGLEGKVSIKVLVGPDGNVLKVGSVNGPDLFHDEVRDKAKNLKFTPGLQNNKPVKVWVTVPFNFKLK